MLAFSIITIAYLSKFVMYFYTLRTLLYARARALAPVPALARARSSCDLRPGHGGWLGSTSLCLTRRLVAYLRGFLSTFLPTMAGQVRALQKPSDWRSPTVIMLGEISSVYDDGAAPPFLMSAANEPSQVLSNSSSIRLLKKQKIWARCWLELSNLLNELL